MKYLTRRENANEACYLRKWNSQKYALIHCMSMDSSGYATFQDGSKKIAFKTETEIEEFLKDSLSVAGIKISCHILILKDGTRVQFVDLEQTAWHAGHGSFKGETDLNNKSIGIELVRDNDIISDDQYTQEQYESLAEFLVFETDLNFEDITYHHDTAPRRKTDPDFFNKEKFKKEFYKANFIEPMENPYPEIIW